MVLTTNKDNDLAMLTVTTSVPFEAAQPRCTPVLGGEKVHTIGFPADKPVVADGEVFQCSVKKSR